MRPRGRREGKSQLARREIAVYLFAAVEDAGHPVDQQSDTSQSRKDSADRSR
jgi:hypothetical protein